ncbi:RDD family protein [Lysobacter yangpyeongensis]|uniref:RDD family protein n=1 Tax=Lysobacter yangpyeongensis TaxID=346182 RepID=A0ABW0SN04_9GAMM
MSQWYYSDYQRNRLGPVAASDLAALHEAGQLQPDTLVWREGMPQWRTWREMMMQALNEAAGRATPEAVPLSAGVNPYAMAEPGPAAATVATTPDRVATAAPLGSLASTNASPSAAHPYTAVEPTSPYAPPRASIDGNTAHVFGGEVVYAGFWKRYAALCIDSLLVGIAYYAVLIAVTFAGFGVAGAAGMRPESMGMGLALMLVGVYVTYPIISGLYYIGFESSSLQATLGKLALGIKVTDENGQRLSRGNALGRWASHLLCYFTLYIGYLIAAFTERKRGLHDMVAGTLVVDKWAYTAHPERQRRELGAVAIVIIALSVLLMIGYAVLIAAIAGGAFQDYLQRAGG